LRISRPEAIRLQVKSGEGAAGGEILSLCKNVDVPLCSPPTRATASPVRYSYIFTIKKTTLAGGFLYIRLQNYFL